MKPNTNTNKTQTQTQNIKTSTRHKTESIAHAAEYACLCRAQRDAFPGLELLAIRAGGEWTDCKAEERHAGGA